MLSINHNSRTRRWLWCASIGLVLALVVVVSVLLVVRNQTSSSPTALETSKPSAVAPSVQPIIESAVAAVDTPPKLPYIDFSPGSVEEACGLNELPRYWNEITNPKGAKLPSNVKDRWPALGSDACLTALENHVKGINPYLWGATYESRPFEFVKLDTPLTFKRVFADPVDDFARVQDALSRPECLLQGDETNWELKETCHAEAFLNYALISRFCFDGGVSNRSRTMYREKDNPTPEQDRLMWKQLLENDWVKAKCEELDPTLELSKHHQELVQTLLTLGDYYSVDMSVHEEMKEVIEMRGENYLTSRHLIPTLIEIAARLGDEVAGLTQPFTKAYSHQYGEEGYKYGRFSWLLTSDEWREFSVKQQPSTERFLRTFSMLAMIGARRPDPRDEIEFDWEWAARHLCTPPYYHRDDWRETEQKEDTALQSCKEIVHEIRQRDIEFTPLLQTLDKFEQVALELGVYE